jgi:hypothetical protein
MQDGKTPRILKREDTGPVAGKRIRKCRFRVNSFTNKNAIVTMGERIATDSYMDEDDACPPISASSSYASDSELLVCHLAKPHGISNTRRGDQP